MRFILFTLLLVSFGVSCGPRSATEAALETQKRTELLVEGGASPFQASLSFMSPEAMAIQEVPYRAGKAAWNDLQRALSRYRNQWTMRLSIGPKPGAKLDSKNPLALDIENNGGQWGDHSRNLQRLIFEMGPFIRIVLPDGKEIEPLLVEFQRSFGMGRDRSFLIIFPARYEGKSLSPPFRLRIAEFGQGMGTLQFEVKKQPDNLPDWQVKRLWKHEKAE